MLGRPLFKIRTMKIQLNREALEKKLQVLVSVIPSRSLIPILDEGLIEVSADSLNITTSDQNITISSKVSCETGEGAELHNFVCDVRTLLGTISLLKSELVTLDVTATEVTLSTPKTRKKYQVPIQHRSEDFPQSRSDEWNDPINLSGKIFSKMIQNASASVTPNSLILSYTGINMYTSEGSLIIQATTGQKCCVTTLSPPEDDKFPDTASVIIPRAIANVSSSYEKSANIKVSIDSDKRNLMIQDGVTTTLVRLIDAKYPNIAGLMTAYQPDINVKFSRNELNMSVKRLSSYLSRITLGIIFDMTGAEEMRVHGADVDFRKEAEEFVTLEHKSSEMSFPTLFNHKFISSMLPTFSGENIFFSQTEAKYSGFFTDDSPEGFSTVWLVSPMIMTKKED